jgi:hypothetical protein
MKSTKKLRIYKGEDCGLYLESYLERQNMLASFIALLMKFFSSTANVKLLLAALAKLSAALG